MNNSTNAPDPISAQYCIGIDIGDKTSQIVVLDMETSKCIEESKVESTEAAMGKAFASRKPSRVALETGTHSPWMSRLLSELGHDVVVANPRKLRLIYMNDSKSDRVDAMYLARLAAADPELLHPIKHRGRQAQVDRTVLVARDNLVGCRTKLINSMRGMAKSLGTRLPSCDARTFHNRVRKELPEALRPSLEPLLEVLAEIHRRISGFDRLIGELVSSRYPEAACMQQVGGVGPITSLDFALTIEDPARFPSSRALGSYLGLRPRRSMSGQRDPQLRITKAGDAMLRRHLVLAAQYILGRHGPDCDLKRFGMKLAGRGGRAAKKKAVVAVARKLAVLLHRLWSTGEAYDPFRNSRAPDSPPPRAAQVQDTAAVN